MTRTQAQAIGLRTYNTGKTCRAGHTSDRYTSTGHCVECQRLRTSSDLVVITDSVHRDDVAMVREIIREINSARDIDNG